MQPKGVLTGYTIRLWAAQRLRAPCWDLTFGSGPGGGALSPGANGGGGGEIQYVNWLAGGLLFVRSFTYLPWLLIWTLQQNALISVEHRTGRNRQTLTPAMLVGRTTMNVQMNRNANTAIPANQVDTSDIGGCHESVWITSNSNRHCSTAEQLTKAQEAQVHHRIPARHLQNFFLAVRDRGADPAERTRP